MAIALDLLAKNPNNIRVLDTAAIAYLRYGQFDKSEEICLRMLKLVEKDTPLWFKAKMHFAEIALENDENDKAKVILELIMKHSKGISGEDILEVNRLLERWRKGGESTSPRLPPSLKLRESFRLKPVL